MLSSQNPPSTSPITTVISSGAVAWFPKYRGPHPSQPREPSAPCTIARHSVHPDPPITTRRQLPLVAPAATGLMHDGIMSPSKHSHRTKFHFLPHAIRTADVGYGAALTRMTSDSQSFCICLCISLQDLGSYGSSGVGVAPGDWSYNGSLQGNLWDYDNISHTGNDIRRSTSMGRQITTNSVLHR